MTLILASASPRRSELLSNAGIPFTVEPARIAEEPLPREQPLQYAQRLARDKASSVFARHSDNVVLGADTIVVVADGVMTRIPRRDSLLRCQTPQAFRWSVLTRAHELARADPDFTPTDDCGVVLHYLPDVPVRVVPGSEDNLKITFPRDLAIAETLLRAGDGDGVSS